MCPSLRHMEVALEGVASVQTCVDSLQTFVGSMSAKKEAAEQKEALTILLALVNVVRSGEAC